MNSQSLPSLLLERARSSSQIAITHKEEGRWKDVSWQELRDTVAALSDALIERGVKPGDRIAVFAHTQMKWVCLDLAVTAARAVVVPLYSSNTAGECAYLINHSQASFLFVDDDTEEGRQPGRLSRTRQFLADCPSVKEVFVFDSTCTNGFTPFDSLLEEGRALRLRAPTAFEERIDGIASEDISHIIYTSGTTGNPKGVMLTHGNWAYEARAATEVAMLLSSDSMMLFLPLAHSFAQVAKTIWLALGIRLCFAESIDKLLPNLAETKPTILPSVPRVFEKVYSGVYGAATSSPGMKGILARWAFSVFDRYAEKKQKGQSGDSLQLKIAKTLVFSKIRKAISEKLGGRMRLFVSGGAPLSTKVGYFFEFLGFVVLEGYGLTETSAATFINRPNKVRIGSVGQVVPGTEVQIADDGEILIRGPGVMKGYYENPEATSEVLRPDGWFHTGDIGNLDDEGILRITDRKKDIIVTAGGKNIAPQNLENALKAFPPISQAMVYGDKRKYLTVLLSLNEEWAKKHIGNAQAVYSELVSHPLVKAEVQRALDALNAKLPPYSTIKDFRLFPQELSQETGELTPTLKVKRKFCTDKYKRLLDSMYDDYLV